MPLRLIIAYLLIAVLLVALVALAVAFYRKQKEERRIMRGGRPLSEIERHHRRRLPF